MAQYCRVSLASSVGPSDLATIDTCSGRAAGPSRVRVRALSLDRPKPDASLHPCSHKVQRNYMSLGARRGLRRGAARRATLRRRLHMFFRIWELFESGRRLTFVVYPSVLRAVRTHAPPGLVDLLRLAGASVRARARARLGRGARRSRLSSVPTHRYTIENSRHVWCLGSEVRDTGVYGPLSSVCTMESVLESRP